MDKTFRKMELSAGAAILNLKNQRELTQQTLVSCWIDGHLML